MKAIVCRAYGPIEGLELAELPDPEPGPRDVVIRARSIGVNFPDGLLVQGLYQAKPDLPFVPGMEVAGTVEALGSEVTGLEPGQEVVGLPGIGAFAEKVRLDRSLVMPLPEGVGMDAATALLCGYGTSHHALRQRAALQPGETLLVTGAAGLTGLAAVQIGKAIGARVIALASTQDKRDAALQAGADEAHGYDDLRTTLKSVGGRSGFDVVFDPVGGDVFDACSRSMAWGGRLLVVGFASGRIPELPANLPLVKGYSLVGVFWGDFTRREPQAFAANMRELFGWAATGAVRPHVERAFPLAEAAAALRHIHDRKAIGKIVLHP